MRITRRLRRGELEKEKKHTWRGVIFPSSRYGSELLLLLFLLFKLHTSSLFLLLFVSVCLPVILSLFFLFLLTSSFLLRSFQKWTRQVDLS